MIAGTPVVSKRDGKEGRTMMRRGTALGRRLLVIGAAAVLALSLAGDRGRAATVPAAVNGQDPLEVLQLKVRPNVIIVLDTSGSMKWGVKAPSSPSGTYYPPQGGDHPRSKVWQAKQVLKQIVQDNQNTVSFLMAQYDQGAADIRMQDRGASTIASGSANRFQYSTYACSTGSCPAAVNSSMTNGSNNNGLLESPTMATTELTIKGAAGDSLGRGLQSWQIIYPQWGTLYYREGSGAVCSATLTGLPKFYSKGADLATDLKNAMNAATCSGGSRANTYNVTYSTANGTFTFSISSGPQSFEIRWADSPNSIAGALGRRGAGNTGLGTGSVTSGSPYTLLYRPSTTATTSADYNGGWDGITFKNTETVASTDVTVYTALAGRFWNGETILVNSSGETCGMTFPTAADRTDPPSFTLQLVNGTTGNCTTSANGENAVFRWGGAYYVDEGSGSYCNGMISRVSLVPCDLQSPPAATQLSTISPWLDNEFPLDTTGMPVAAPVDNINGGTTTGYTEAQDGSWATTSYPVFGAGGMKAYGSTPIAASLADIKTLFGTATTGLWGAGQTGATAMAGPPPYQLDAIKNHKDPKEKTIVLFVTDGADTCAGSGDGAAESAANSAKNLYQPVVQQCLDTGDSVTAEFPCQDQNNNGIYGFKEPASSVQTYMIGYGDGVNSPADVNRLNWIAWGGSGLNVNFSNYGTSNNTTTNDTLKAERDKCPTCRDAFIAPDAATLASTLQGIIDQGASDGDFNAQQSITESVFEYVDLAQDAAGTYAFNPDDPGSRYKALAPVRIVSSFSLPGFRGQLRAYMNDGSGNAVQKWSAGDKLRQLVTYGDSNATSCSAGGTCSCNDGGTGVCTFSSLQTTIKRRIFTTSRNGVYTFSSASLADTSWTPPERVSLWPTASAVVPNDYTSQGSLDVAMGLPSNAATCTLRTGYANCIDQAIADLQAQYKACLGGNLPAGCTTTDATTKMLAARREAREMILAFMAGAAPVPNGTGVSRTSSGSILYTARSWMLADSELATVGVMTPPSLSEPEATTYVPEYRLYRDGVGTTPRTNSDLQVRQGFGLAQPDIDKVTGSDAGRSQLKPVMTVVYAPANDMLHAFRAGPNCVSGSRTNTCAETGGEELWGFVPYDQLNALGLRLANEPQGRSNHVFMLTRGVRFADVFVPGAANINIGGYGPQAVNGVWRRVLYFGRGIGGKYVTALDVTAPGPYTALARNTDGPIPLWSRGNPDTYSGGLQQDDSQISHDQHDYDLYRRMGETWSMPTIAFVNPDKNNPHYVTSRRPDGVDFVIFMGSGYGTYNDHGLEGVVHYTLDALSGDVIAAADVEAEATALGIARSVPSQVPYFNSLVANSVSFNRSRYSSITAQAFNDNPHPWSKYTTRVYIGDLHGRLWRFLTTSPGAALPVADLGADQPIGTAVALLAAPPDAALSTSTDLVPEIFATAGNERRATEACLVPPSGYPSGLPCFRNFSFVDEGDDADLTVGPTTIDGSDNTTTYAPVVKRFSRVFDQGEPDADCGYTTQAVFRGTIQPTGAVECSTGLTGSRCTGTLLQRVFFGGTRLSLPNTIYAPPTPLACSIGEYPCRSQFDTILYALGVVTGQAAYDMNATGDDAYRIFRDSRIAALSNLADPDPNRGGSSFTADEGLMKGTPKPPPPPGVPPTATTATANVVMRRIPGQPPPAVRYGSSVCSEQP
jgi:hypothetical protein